MRWPDADFFKWRKGRTLLASVLLSWALLWLADWLGVPLHLRELDYDTQFRYPLEVDALPLVRRLQRGEAPEDLLPPPANPNDTPFTAECREKCEAGRPVQLLLLVKSAAQHLERRQAIRQTWGRERRPSGVQVGRPGPGQPVPSSFSVLVGCRCVACSCWVGARAARRPSPTRSAATATWCRPTSSTTTATTRSR